MSSSPTTLLSSWDLTQLSGEPHTLIRVRNLQTVLPIGTDAWGRPNKSQPVLISASISLSRPFESASESDTVTNSTVHYGVLSKGILGACAEFEGLCEGKGGNGKTQMLLFDFVLYLKSFLEGLVTGMQGSGEGAQEMRMLEVEVLLPKASLLGSGVSLQGSFLCERDGGPERYSMVLKLHELMISTLIGVNPNERLAKQMVVANVEMDRWDMEADGYCELEEIVVKTIDESSFETLEALSSHLSANIVKYFLLPKFTPNIKAACLAGIGLHNHQRIRIALAKPTAVMFADAPVIEVLVDSDPNKSQVVRKIWESTIEAITPPFPLRRTLSAWEQEQQVVKNEKE